MSLRDIRDRARRDLHAKAAFPAIYVSPGVNGTATPCTIRVLDKTKTFGNMKGVRYQPAEIAAEVPEVVVLAEVLTPTRGGIFSVSPVEAWAVEVPMPPVGVTISAQVTRLTTAQIAAAALPVP